MKCLGHRLFRKRDLAMPVGEAGCYLPGDLFKKNSNQRLRKALISTIEGGNGQ
jgi:hypothetical protein